VTRRAHSSVIVLSTRLSYETCGTVHDATRRDPTHPCAFAAQGSRGGEIASTAFKWVHASWDDAGAELPFGTHYGRGCSVGGRTLDTQVRIAGEIDQVTPSSVLGFRIGSANKVQEFLRGISAAESAMLLRFNLLRSIPSGIDDIAGPAL
jgi:hypothetical protein